MSWRSDVTHQEAVLSSSFLKCYLLYHAICARLPVDGKSPDAESGKAQGCILRDTPPVFLPASTPPKTYCHLMSSLARSRRRSRYRSIPERSSHRLYRGRSGDSRPRGRDGPSPRLTPCSLSPRRCPRDGTGQPQTDRGFIEPKTRSISAPLARPPRWRKERQEKLARQLPERRISQ